jgi:hypothetical protein
MPPLWRVRLSARQALCGVWRGWGSVSEGTGFPLVRDRGGDGRLYHVRCLPGTHDPDAVWSGLEKTGG